MARAMRISVIFLVLAVWAVVASADVGTFEELDRRHGAVGSYKALVIGIEAYADAGIAGSSVAVSGARRVADALKKEAGFDVKLLVNAEASRAAVLRELRGLARGMGVNDSVVVYYSGSSQVDTAARRAWWLPSDAMLGDKSSWISGREIQAVVNTMKARDVILLSDAALGDNLFGATHRLPSNRDGAYYVDLFNKRSRWAMVSGNTLPVPDGKGVSLFASGIARALATDRRCLSTMEMYSSMKKGLRKAGEMLPRCRSLRNTGDQGGEFVFLLTEVKPNPVAKVPVKPVVVPVVKLDPPKPKPRPQATSGHLDVTSNIRGAELFVNGKKKGQTPMQGIVLKAGTHKIRLNKDGYLAWNGSVKVERGKGQRLVATLKKAPSPKGKLFVSVKPAKAVVRLGGSVIQSGVALDPGTYTLKVSSPLHTPRVVKALVTAGKDAWVEVILKPVPDFKGDWGRFVLIKPGSFRMGSPSTEARRKDDESSHAVTLSRGFFMQSREVTVSQWEQFVAATGYKNEAETAGGAFAMEDYVWRQSREYSWQNPGFSQGKNHPVTGVTYRDVLAFLKWVNGSSPYTYRLPTESEWEYAARAGQGDAFFTGPCLESSQANVDANIRWGDCPVGSASSGTVAVGSFPPNAWGLFDMHGNVGEWCQDWYGRYPAASAKNPTGPDSGTNRVARGGGWATYAYNSRSAHREAMDPTRASSDVGFRLVINVPR